MLRVLPQFSLRWLLAIISACAVFFFIVNRALTGSYWAVVISYAGASLFVVLLVHAAMFCLVWLFSMALDGLRRLSGRAPGSPFQPGALAEPTAPPIATS